MDPDKIEAELKELGEHIDTLIERCEQQSIDIKRTKRALSDIELSISPEQEGNKRSGEA